MAETFAQQLNDLLQPMLYNQQVRLLPIPNAKLTYSGNEITDVVRVADGSWPITQNVGSTDGLTPPAGLGIWHGATNWTLHGQCDSTSNFGPGDVGSTTATIDTLTPAPFSPQSIKVVTTGLGTAQHVGMSTGAFSAAAGNIGLSSVYAKGTAGQTYFIQLYFVNSDTTMTAGTQAVFTANGNWQYFVAPKVSVATGKTATSCIMLFGPNTVRADTYWVAHPMIEQSSFNQAVSPYIATSGGAGTVRLNPRVSAPSTLINATQSWFACRIRWGFNAPDSINAGNYIFQLSDGTFNNRLVGYFSVNTYWFGNDVNGAVDWSTAGGVFNRGDYATVVFAWTATQAKVSVNGAPFATPGGRPKGIPPGMNTLDIGSALGSAQLDGSMFWAATGTGTLTDIDASIINGFGNAPPTQFADAAQVTSVLTLSDTNVYNAVLGSDLTSYLDSLGDPLFQVVQDWSSDTDDVPSKPGYSILVDANRVPDVAIPWLAQFVGTPITTGMPPAQQRTQLTGLGTWKRGTVAALQAAPLPFLTGSKTVIVKERDTDPYHLQVMTYANETPNSATVLAALLTQKPAGLVMNYVVFSGQKAFQVRGGSALRGTPPDVLRLVI